jgi:hypothetical protein
MTTKSSVVEEMGFHSQEISEFFLNPQGQPGSHPDTKFTYTFETFFHPFVGELIATLNQGTLADMMNPETLHKLTDSTFFKRFYLPNPDPSPTVDIPDTPDSPLPSKRIDVSSGGPYANYNWEMLFHLPLAVAVHLSKNQRFAEARRWFHLIFDPTCTDNLPPLQRFWKFLAFRYAEEPGTPARLGDLLLLLSKPPGELTTDETKTKDKLLSGYHGILNNPFQPHVVARTRQVAYQYSVVMKYLDNLIAAGDSLFTQYTVESLAEATLYYVLAANILGKRPQQVPQRGTIQAKSFADLNAPLLDSKGNVVIGPNGKPIRGVDEMGNALVDLEAQFPFNFADPPPQGQNGPDGSGSLFGIGRTLYFCIPPNDKLLGYWDTVADRLFKIRHCMDIEGVVRPLALFDPPLDPGMLVKAAAAGIDIGSIVSGLSQPTSPVRCQVLIQKAIELGGEVRGLGNALLSALEKADGEHLAVVRQDHEIKLQQLSQDVKFLQWKQAQAATDAILRTRDTALERYKYYLRLLGQQPDTNNVPDTLALDRSELTEENFDDTYQALVSQYDKTITIQNFSQLKLAGGASPANQSGVTGAGNLFLNANEDAELNGHLPTARDTRIAASALNTIAAVVTFIPELNAHLAFWGLGAAAKVFGGSKLSDELKIGAEILQTVAAWEQDQAGMASRTASYQRRADEWMLQANLAARELMQIGRQLLTSLIVEQVAHHDYLNIQSQIAQSQEVRQFLEDKFTNEELYGWMQGEASRLFYEYYRFAVDTARKAERTMKQELMRPEVDATDFIQFNYWDAGRKGLLSGDALHLDLKRMEMAYLDNNKRELEITRHVSLRQLDPLALLSLKLTGRCELAIPEWLYDLDCPGLYLRRIKTVALSLPAVVGPYTTINCTLTLLRSSIRKKPELKNDKYARDLSGDDDRFVDYVGGAQAIVTSGGTNDAGMFETNLRDERFLPFEGMGAVSAWRLELPKDFQPFDYATISDAILHIRYTARQGADSNTAMSELTTQFPPEGQPGLALLFSLRHDYPTEWSAFVNTKANTFSAVLKRDYFPYFAQGKSISVGALELYTSAGTPTTPSTTTDDLTTALKTGSATMVLDKVPNDPAAQVFLVVRYSLS